MYYSQEIATDEMILNAFCNQRQTHLIESIQILHNGISQLITLHKILITLHKIPSNDVPVRVCRVISILCRVIHYPVFSQGTFTSPHDIVVADSSQNYL